MRLPTSVAVQNNTASSLHLGYTCEMEPIGVKLCGCPGLTTRSGCEGGVRRPRVPLRVDRRRRDEPGFVVDPDPDLPLSDEPSFPVHQPMMRTAQQDQVVHHRRAAIGPVPNMVRIGPGGDACAAGERTAFVSRDQRDALFGGDQPFSGFRIERRAVIVE